MTPERAKQAAILNDDYGQSFAQETQKRLFLPSFYADLTVAAAFAIIAKLANLTDPK